MKLWRWLLEGAAAAQGFRLVPNEPLTTNTKAALFTLSLAFGMLGAAFMVCWLYS